MEAMLKGHASMYRNLLEMAKPGNKNMPRNNVEYYDRDYAAKYDRHRTGQYFSHVNACEVELVQKYGRGKRLLEVGCGTGLILAEVEQFAASAMWIDLSEDMLRHARKRGLRVRQAPATDLPFPDESFDVVYSFKVLPHIEVIEEALAEMGRVLAPGGTMIAEFYPKYSLKGVGKFLTPPDNFTRVDRYRDVLSYLPPGYQVREARGFKIFCPSLAFRLPLLGSAIKAVDRAVSRTRLGRLGSYFSIVAVKPHTQAPSNAKVA